MELVNFGSWFRLTAFTAPIHSGDLHTPATTTFETEVDLTWFGHTWRFTFCSHDPPRAFIQGEDTGIPLSRGKTQGEHYERPPLDPPKFPLRRGFGFFHLNLHP